MKLRAWVFVGVIALLAIVAISMRVGVSIGKHQNSSKVAASASSEPRFPSSMPAPSDISTAPQHFVVLGGNWYTPDGKPVKGPNKLDAKDGATVPVPDITLGGQPVPARIMGGLTVSGSHPRLASDQVLIAIQSPTELRIVFEQETFEWVLVREPDMSDPPTYLFVIPKSVADGHKFDFQMKVPGAGPPPATPNTITG